METRSLRRAGGAQRTAGPGTARVAGRGAWLGGAGVGLRVSWLVAIPAIVIYLVIELLPALVTLGYSFTDWNGLTAGANLVWFDNFIAVVENPRTRAALLNTVIFTLVVVVVQNVIGLALALAVHRGLRTASFVKVAVFAPVALSPLVVGYVWQFMYAPNGGAVNALLEGLGLGELTRAWLGDPSAALFAIAATVIWQHAGYSMVIFLAGLEGIPEEINEAASIDRAGWWSRLFHITIPLLAPALTINLVISGVSSLKQFDQVIAMTGGGPGYSTETVATVIYKQAFSVGDFGTASALGVLLTILVVLVSIAQIRILRGRDGSSAGKGVR